MKRFLMFICIFLFFIISINADDSKCFIEVDENVEIDEQVYSFFCDFFSKYSKNLLDTGSRMILNDKNPRLLNFNYYDRQGYFNSYFLDDEENFYIIDKIIIKSKKREIETFDLYLDLGILADEFYDITYIIKSVYDEYGKKYSGNIINEFTDKIGIFRYSDKCRLSMLGATTAYTWVLAIDEEAMVEKLKNGELKIEKKEDPNHYTEQ